MVGICLRARKHKLIEFEGEMLFQRRDDDVPIFLLKPIKEIRQLLDIKTEEIKRGASPAPQATSVLLDKRSRSASPNVGKIQTVKEPTAKVPEIKESTKEGDTKTEVKEKLDGSLMDLVPPAIEIQDENQEKVTIESEIKPATEIIIEESKQELTEESTEILPPLLSSEDIPKAQVEEQPLEADAKEVLTSVAVPEIEQQPDIILNSSSITEIIESAVEIEKLQEENNNISEN